MNCSPITRNAAAKSEMNFCQSPLRRHDLYFLYGVYEVTADPLFHAQCRRVGAFFTNIQDVYDDRFVGDGLEGKGGGVGCSLLNRWFVV